jgi:hypothetical protein
MLRTLHVLPLPRVAPFVKGWSPSTAPTFSRLWVRRLYYIVHCRYMNSGYAAPDAPWFDLHHVILSNVDSKTWQFIVAQTTQLHGNVAVWSTLA